MSRLGTDTDTDLTLRSTRARTAVGGVALVIAATALAAWYSQHPDALPTEQRTVMANTPVDEPIYIGVAQAPAGRTLHLSGVKVRTTSNTEVTVTPLLCRGGRIEATTEPEAFCGELINPEDQDLSADDSIVLRVTSAEPAVAVIEPVRLAFRESLQWATMPTGAGAVVQVLTR